MPPAPDPAVGGGATGGCGAFGGVGGGALATSHVGRHACSPFARFADAHHLTHVAEAGIAYVHNANNAKRYAFLKRWGTDGALVMWVMFNPGTGEIEQRRRPTLERCEVWSRTWGYAGLLIGNLYAERSRAAIDLRSEARTRDPCNEEALGMMRAMATEVVVAWGNPLRRDHAAECTLDLLGPVQCLGTTRKGHPRHPLYVSRKTERVAFTTPWRHGA